MRYQALREEICSVGRLLYERGYVVSNDGNLSVRTEENTILITPTGVSKGRMTPEMLLETDLDGRILEGERHPSSEEKMHRKIYRHRPDVRAVAHAHPPVATAFAVCRRSMSVPYLAELVVGLGEVPVTPEFAMLSTDEVAESLRPYLQDYHAVLLANHGLVAWGEDLWQAFDRLESVEHVGKILMNVNALGGGVALSEEQVNTLLGLRGMYRRLREKRGEEQLSWKMRSAE